MNTASGRFQPVGARLAAVLLVGVGLGSTWGAHAEPGVDPVTEALRSKVKTIVVIYAENRAFDNLYGNFPGADGLGTVVDANDQPLPSYVLQRDRDGSVLKTLPQSWGGVTASGYQPVVTQAQSGGLANAPFSIETAPLTVNIPSSAIPDAGSPGSRVSALTR